MSARSEEVLYRDFLGFCANATDRQLAEILEREWSAWKGGRDDNRRICYRAAVHEAALRGWYVHAGKVG